MRKAGLWEQPAGTETTLLASWGLPATSPSSSAQSCLSVLRIENKGLQCPQTAAHLPSLSGVPSDIISGSDSAFLHLPASPGLLFRKTRSRCNSQRTRGLASGPAWRWLGWALFLVEGVSLFPRGCLLPVSSCLLHVRPLVPSPAGRQSGSRPCPCVLSLLRLGTPHLTTSAP